MPSIFIIAGPNGAGKSSVAHALLPELECKEYVNADNIAAGLSPFAPEKTALQAGRLMLERIHHLVNLRKDFAFETTMTTRSFIPYLQNYKRQGYTIHLIFLWLQHSQLAIDRVNYRVANGGHKIPENIIYRRYTRCFQNFLNLYIPLADSWLMYDNSVDGIPPSIVAQQRPFQPPLIFNQRIWNNAQELETRLPDLLDKIHAGVHKGIAKAIQKWFDFVSANTE